MTTSQKVALLVGAGDAIGAAVARRFAQGGYTVCIARREADKSRALVEELRSNGLSAIAISTDARNEEEIQRLFREVEEKAGPISVCLFNAGSNVQKPLLDTSGKLFTAGRVHQNRDRSDRYHRPMDRHRRIACNCQGGVSGDRTLEASCAAASAVACGENHHD